MPEWPKLSFNRATSLDPDGLVIVESVGVFGRDFRLFELELRLFILRNHDDVPLDSNNKSQMSENHAYMYGRVCVCQYNIYLGPLI